MDLDPMLVGDVGAKPHALRDRGYLTHAVGCQSPRDPQASTVHVIS